MGKQGFTGMLREETKRSTRLGDGVIQSQLYASAGPINPM